MKRFAAVLLVPIAAFFWVACNSDSSGQLLPVTPCPSALPETGNRCALAGEECGYSTSTNACGAANCYCQSGAWNCEPTCALLSDASFLPDAADGAADADGPSFQCTDTSRVIQASNYDQSCQTDSDCVGVGTGYSCECETVFCVTAVINVSAYTQWKSDVGYAQYVSDIAKGASMCGCPVNGQPFCQSGTCQRCFAGVGALCDASAGPVDAGHADSSAE